MGTSPKASLDDVGLDTRIANLEEKLRKAVKAEEAHQHTEAGLRDALAYAETIVDTVREPLLVLDGDLRVLTASHAFYQTFGVSREDTEGRLLYDLGNGQWNIPALRNLLEEVLPLEKSFRDFEVLHEFPGLGRRVLLLNARKLWREGNHTERVLLAIEDFTEHKRLEEELLRSNEDLQRFAYVAAHDLRSPLNSALNLSQLLAERLEGRLEEDESRMLALSVESMQRLGALMQDILTYAEMSTAPRQQALVPLQEALRIALANLQHEIDRNEADIRVGSLPDVRGDLSQLAMVFQNLIGNALKYRIEESPCIRIEAMQEGNHWRLSVSDNGEGFEAEYATQIFEPFKRLHGRKVPGSGIGLATCRRIIERLGGRIWAESTPNKGSTFHVTLPIDRITTSVQPPV
jgi:PAS domain S-box-containing protein